MMGDVRVAYTLEQCWHRVPGGTAVAALEVAREMPLRHPDVELVGVAGTHDDEPADPWRPPIPVRNSRGGHGARLYASWLFAGRPRVERATGPVDVAHATSIIPCPSSAPLVVTVHDLAFLHEPAHFTRWGRLLFARSIRVLRRRGALVLCASSATMDDCRKAGVPDGRLRLVPLGVRSTPASAAEIERVRSTHRLPDRYLLFVGTIEPRKNLARLAEAIDRLDDPIELVVAGASGWGDAAPRSSDRVRFLGFVPQVDIGPLYAGAEVACYPSIREGFGLPVLEAMAQGTPVVTSRGTSTEEAAGGAAVLVDPFAVDDIAAGIEQALADDGTLAAAGRARSAVMTWGRTADLTVAAYREAAAR